MATLVGRAQIFGITSAAFNGTAASLKAFNASSISYSPRIDSAGLTVGGQSAEEVNQSGEVYGLRFFGEYLECAFKFTPDSDTGAHALTSATIPAAGSYMTTQNFPVVAAGSFSDAFNAATSSSSPWLIQPGASIELVKDGVATLSFTARRYANVTSGVTVT